MIELLLPVRPESPVLQARITPPPSACQHGLECLHSNARRYDARREPHHRLIGAVSLSGQSFPCSSPTT